MGLSPIEILAVIFAVAVLLKVLIFVIKPGFILQKARKIINKKDSSVFMIGHLLVLLLIGFFMIKELNIMQIATAMFFTTVLMGMTLRAYPKTMLKVIQDISNIGPERIWLPLAIWTLIALAVLYYIFIF